MPILDAFKKENYWVIAQIETFQWQNLRFLIIIHEGFVVRLENYVDYLFIFKLVI